MSKQRLVGGQSQRDLPPGSRVVAGTLPALPRIASALDYPTRPVHIVGLADRRCIGLGKAYARLVAVGELEAGPLGFGAAGPGPAASFVDELDGRPRSDVDLASFCQMPSLRIMVLKRERSSARNDHNEWSLRHCCGAATFDCPSKSRIY